MQRLCNVGSQQASGKRAAGRAHDLTQLAFIPDERDVALPFEEPGPRHPCVDLPVSRC